MFWTAKGKFSLSFFSGRITLTSIPLFNATAWHESTDTNVCIVEYDYSDEDRSMRINDKFLYWLREKIYLYHIQYNRAWWLSDVHVQHNVI